MSTFPNRQMKLWEVVSGFREYSEVVNSVLKSPQWKEHYANHLENWSDLVNTQRRDILDQLVPLELTREICKQCPNLYVLWPDSTSLVQAEYYKHKDLPKLTALDVHDHYGPAVLEEVHEKGGVKVA